MSTYTQLTQEERYQIQVLMKAGHNQTEIAEILERHKSTISRELRRNPGMSNGLKPMFVQIFVSELSVEAFDICILRGLTWLNQLQLNSIFISPLIQGSTGKFRSSWQIKLFCISESAAASGGFYSVSTHASMEYEGYLVLY